ncbi:MAG: helix-turn-helix transcriptional regulator [Aquamicrobium sp.]|nr:helix-turn-helix transcriptional regulator [Aquamicrobium sp.]
MQDNQNIDGIILSIYDAAVEPDRWPAVLDRIARMADARGAFIFDIDTSPRDGPRVGATYHTTNYERPLIEAYLRRHNEEELRDQATFAAFSRSGDQVELVPDSVLAPSRQELMQHANAQTMASYGIHHRAGALLNKDHYYSDRFAVQFSQRAGPATGERLRALQTVMPHIAKALNIGRHTSRQFTARHAILDVFDLLRIGICILTASGEVVMANKEFERQRDHLGAFRIDHTKRLLASNEAVRLELASLFASAGNHGKFGARPRKEAVLHPLEQDGMALCLEVTPLFMPDMLGDRAFSGFALFSLDTSQAYNIDTSFLAQAFSLTKSEEAILSMLAEGLTNAQISERRQRSLETVSSQVKTVLAKTMSQNRTQLIRLATEFNPRMFVGSTVPHTGDEEKVHTE